MILSQKEFKKELAIDLEKEVKSGLNYSDFIALANISKEFLPMKYSKKEILEIWKSYRVNNRIQEQYREEPMLFDGFEKVIGRENIVQCAKLGGCFATFHFGAYRHVPLFLGKIVEEEGIKKQINIVMDQESYQNEQHLIKWNNIKSNFNTETIIADDRESGFKLLSTIRREGNIILYLDGNTGHGEDSQPMQVRHISSTIKVRSGIFRLLSLYRKPICIVVADYTDSGEPILIAEKLIYVDKLELADAIEKCYQIFRGYLHHHPSLWRFWYRHHRYVLNWEVIDLNDKHRPTIDWFTDTNDLGLDLDTGNIYMVNQSERSV